MTEKEGWVVYNGSLGVADKVTIGLVEEGEGGRSACLAPPYDAVGPFSLDELETQGQVAFGACIVLSLQKWAQLQDELRAEALKKRRALMLRDAYDGQEHREILKLPMEGELLPSEINAAFRRLAKKAHPDAGGSNEDYRRISEARDALIEQYENAS
ncbi:J domain-containing protein [Methyloferula stellata]|uniref:J domain-containing protein n=1 Tax=Methyloferula stellata TaxID=876270 RepID=UPI000370E3FD|nr:J domain-containing protein [Methyloferula stellata]